MSLAVISPLRADTTYTAVDAIPYIDGFQYDDGTGNDYWWEVDSSTVPESGHIIYTYADGKLGLDGNPVHSTMEWDPATAKLVNWTITLGGGGGSLSYTGGTSAGYGYRVGWFTQTSGSTSLNKIIGINGVPYQPAGELLGPTLTSTTPPDATFLLAFTYNGTTYQPLDVSNDYQWRTISHCAGGVTVVSCAADLVNYPEQIEINFPDGKYARYIGEKGITYTYRPSSTALNKLTKINGYPLSASGATVSLPRPSIQNFVWNGNLYTLAIPYWETPISPTAGIPLRLVYFYTSDTAVFSGNPEGVSPNGFCSGYQAICSASINSDGSFVSLWVQDSPDNDSGSIVEEDGLLLGGPVNFSLQEVMGNCSFTSINGHPYTTNGAAVIPVPPVNTLAYDGKTYHYVSTSASGGSMATLYSEPGGRAATVVWSRATDEVVSLQVRPYPAAPTVTATYVNGDTVGRPGAYVLSGTYTSLNKLTQIDSHAFTPNGDAALPTGGYVNSNGVFDVKGDFMSLGSWSNDANHVGFSLSYDDGEPVTVPASVEFTASRPLTTWLWSAATADGGNSTQLMQLDHASRLMLYPPTSNAPGAPAVPTPTVVLDPNPGGMSRFDGPARFNGSVRIAPQGDLSMGAFTSDPVAAQ